MNAPLLPFLDDDIWPALPPSWRFGGIEGVCDALDPRAYDAIMIDPPCGRIGNPRVRSRRPEHDRGARREHSRKPDEGYSAAEALFGPGRRADVFACERRPGWEAWGEEVGKYGSGCP
jgi:hypothetical protein